jgi:DNA-binding GntR family transcriptional regulator
MKFNGKNKFQTKSDIIYQELKQDIIKGKFKPRERIVISKVAKKFGTSEIPVREAIKHLESDGLIHHTPYVGAVVTSFNFEDVRKIYQVRTVLEGMATGMAAENIGQKEMNSLKKIVSKMEKGIQSGHYESLAQLNVKFHNIIYSASGNAYLNKMISELWSFSTRSRAIFIFVPDRARKAVEEHIDILKALKGEDGILAEKLVHKHNEAALKALQVYLKQNEVEEERNS